MPHLFKKTRQTIGLLTKSLVEERRSPCWEELANLAEEHDINLLVVVGGILKSPIGFEAQGNILYDFVNPSNVDGVIVTGGLGHYIGVAGLQKFCERLQPLPLVSLDVMLEGFPSILPNFYDGMRAVMKHLVEDHGYRRIGFICGSPDSQTGEDRYHAYLDSLQFYGLPLDPDLVAPGTFFPPSGANAVHLLFDERKVVIDALVSANDFMAIDAIQALQARGFHIPEDIAVTGFDNLEIAHQLTTVELPSQKEAHLAAEMLLQKAQNKSRTDIEMELVLRQSCGCQSLAMEHVNAASYIYETTTDKTDLLSNLIEELVCQGKRIQTEMLKACGPSPSQSEQNLVFEFGEAFVQDLQSGDDEKISLFLRKVSGISSPIDWQGVLSIHRRVCLPIMNNPDAIRIAENLWQRGRVSLAETALNQRTQLQFSNDELAATLRSVGESLITTLNINGLTNTVVRELPRLQIPACYISLYENKDSLAGYSRLILAYNRSGRLSLPIEGYLFQTREILPGEFLANDHRSSLVVYPLQFHEDQLGLVAFEVGPHNGIIYETLSLQLSSALRGALLVQEMQKRADELARYNLQLETSLEINQKIGALLNQEAVTRTFVEMIRTRYDFQNVQYYYYVETGTAIQFFEAAKTRTDALPIAFDESFLEMAINSLEPFVMKGMNQERIFLPVRVGKKILGVLDIHGHGIVKLTRQEKTGLQALANQFGITLRNVDLYDEALQAREAAIQAQALAEKADELKTRLLANVSHELRTPLNVILGYSRMALLEPNPYQLELPPTLRRDLENIYSSGEHLIRLINDLLDLSRAEIGELNLFPEPVAPRALLEQAFRVMADSARPKPGLNWKLELPQRLPIIQVDPTRLRQIILNLLSNADKFTETGEIILGADVTPPHLHIWVQDSGTGIPIDQQEHIFQPFVTARNDKKHTEGIGLGLAITRRLIALHGGSLSLESQPAKGSIFHLYLPLPNLSGRILNVPPKTTNDTAPTLLLISSAEVIAPEIQAMAKRSGWELEHISSQIGLKTSFDQARPVALAWDLENARPGDWSIVQKIRSHPHFGSIPFILFRKEENDDIPGARITNILTKPLSTQTLADLIESFKPSTAGGNVLVVDDDRQARELYFRLVSEKLPGYPVTLAEDGSVALEWLEHETPSLVILDLSMPNVDGFTVLEQLRANPRTRMTPVFILTGRMLSYQDIQRLDYNNVVIHIKQLLSNDEMLANLRHIFSGVDMFPQPTSRLVKQVLVYIQQNYTHTLTRPEIATAVGVSEDYLSRIFNKEMGLSPWDYLNRFRIIQARKLLSESKENITLIASMVGFDDPAYFSRVFQKLVGCSPREFRIRAE